MIIGQITPEPVKESDTFDYLLKFTREEHAHLIELSRKLKDPYDIKNVLRKALEIGLRSLSNE